MVEKKKKSPTAKRAKPAEAPKKDYPDADPEWEHLEERYSEIGSQMRDLAKMLNVSGGGDSSEQ